MKSKTGIKYSMPKLYNSWRGMRDRCRSLKRADAPSYSGKGITIDPAWESIDDFKDWALANGYREGLTIERRENSKGYTADNCTWVDRKAQARNTDKNRFITHDGKRLCIGEWSEVTGIPSASIRARIDRLGWSESDALTIAVGAIPTGPKPKGGKTC
jgi:hypothetical protein